MDDNREDSGGKMTREERLAAKLRENLKRRKVQARAMAEPPAAPDADTAPESAGHSALPKEAEDR